MPNQARGRTLLSVITCTCCGSSVDLEEFNPKLLLPKLMKKEQLCFTCAFWKDKINNPDPKREIINGSHYTFNPWTETPKPFMGHGGRSFYILRNDGSVMRSNNVWFQGDIPEMFKTQLPDTARFITKSAYTRIKQHPHFKCKSKGCWDRHHCFWYDASLEVNGPWNVIPASHKVGEECCESFLNKQQVYG